MFADTVADETGDSFGRRRRVGKIAIEHEIGDDPASLPPDTGFALKAPNGVGLPDNRNPFDLQPPVMQHPCQLTADDKPYAGQGGGRSQQPAPQCGAKRQRAPEQGWCQQQGEVNRASQQTAACSTKGWWVSAKVRNLLAAADAKTP
ncbi:MAG: hypothetical protein MO852_07990 [Candidatus Devosia euplotis]|nr:hypothetical protein [Candidatus Devosia euplotis]